MKQRAEASIAIGVASLCAATSLLTGLPLTLPAADSAAFVGLHYLYPLMAVSIFGVVSITMNPGFAIRMDRKSIIRCVLCYAIVIYAYFTFKLWIPHLRPSTYDAWLWSVDRQYHGIVERCISIRKSLEFLIPYETNAYMFVYVATFYVGIVGQARLAPDYFRELVLACMLMQVIGTVGYLAFPAVGPFIYEAGTNPVITAQQKAMYAFYQSSVAFGPGWLRDHGANAFTAGLAAMPSLHVSGMTLFFLNACRRTRRLAPAYGVLLVYICIAAVANRWHYLLDVPAGVLVAAVSLFLAERLLAWERRASARAPAMTGSRGPKERLALSAG